MVVNRRARAGLTMLGFPPEKSGLVLADQTDLAGDDAPLRIEDGNEEAGEVGGNQAARCPLRVL